MKKDENIAQVNKLAKIILQVKGAILFVKDYWVILGVLWFLFVGGVTLWYNQEVEPTMNKYVTKVTHKWMEDSLGIFIDSHMAEKGGGFRGRLADTLDISKEDVVHRFARLALNEDSMWLRLNELGIKVAHARAIADLSIHESFRDTTNSGVKLLISLKGEMFYLDSLKIPWGAFYRNRKWVYFPPYNNNQMTDCKVTQR